MSDTTVMHAPRAAHESPAHVAPARESVLGVIGVVLGVLLLLALVGTLAMLGRPPKALDAATVLAERFESAGPFPYGLTVVGADAERGGREIVRLEGPRAGVIVSGSKFGPKPPAEGPKPAKIEWDTLPATEGQEPVRAALAWVPRKRAESVLRDQFTSLRFETAGGMGGMGGGFGGGGMSGMSDPGKPPEAPKPKLQDAGTIGWSGYAAPYVRLREFDFVDGTPRFQETVRVNLTVGEHCCVLYLRWAPGEVGGRDATLAVLAALVPRAGV